MKRFIGKSLLQRYLISFVSIAMFSCAVVGMIIYLAAVQELRVASLTEQEKRLSIAVDDMDEQFDQLLDIATRIQISTHYMPPHFSRNPYYEIELLADLKRYGNYSSLLRHYFIRYEGNDAVFSEMGKSYMHIYAPYRLGYDDPAALGAYLDQCTEPCFLPLQDSVLAVYPIKMSSSRGYTGKASVCFLITDTALLERLQLVSGEQFTRGQLRRGDALVMSCGDIEDPLTISGEVFSLTVDRSEITSEIGTQFTTLSIVLIGVFIVLFCTLAAALAVRNYRPIGYLAQRYNLQPGEHNELELLDQALVNMEGQLRLSREQLDIRLNQLRLVRSDLQKHFVLQMLRGNADDGDLARMREAGMLFPGRRFHAFIVSCSSVNPNDAVHSFEELSDERAAFFAAPFGGDGRYAVLVNADKCPEAADMLHDSCSGAKVFGGRSTDELSEIPALLFDALTEAEPSCIRPSDIARCREDERLRKFRKALENGDEEQAMQSLHEYCAVYASDDKTIAHMIYGNITSVLLAASYEANMNVPRVFLRGSQESMPMLEGWVSALCKGREVASTSEEHQIIRYLREHALDYDLSLDLVSETFHRSARQISRIVQAETGGNYKEFILHIRMEHAKAMLRDGASVGETCERVCYASRSHFIKTFTDYTGLTPSRWREQEQAKPSSNHTQQEG